ncbi:MAG TPA: alpha/beta hydrolase-fold protein [Hanamia sp.]|nr:alpha/beta hydrolase-fold protein [Hanamia sp.]
MKILIIGIFLFLSFQVAVAQDSISPKKNIPFVLGRIDEIQSKILSEKRVLNIYLPQGYHQNDTTRYPVIYLLDGSADEDFIHIAGLVQFLNFPWVHILPKSILVGIANVDRKRDFTFPTTIAEDKKESPTSGGSKKFILFIENELQPFIEKNYKTNSSKTIIGQSLGALLATQILFEKPELFTNYIIVSPSLWWNNESLLTTEPKFQKKDFTQNTSIYVAVGNEGKIMRDDAEKLISILQKDHQKNLLIHFQYFPDENHGTILHRAVYAAFECFSKDNESKIK